LARVADLITQLFGTGTRCVGCRCCCTAWGSARARGLSYRFGAAIQPAIWVRELSEIGRSLHVSTTVAGQLATVFALTYAVLAPVAAVVTGRWSRQRRLRAALALFTAGTAVSAVAPWFWLAMVGRVTAAAGASAYTPAAVAAAGRWRRRAGGARRWRSS
jgi:MFS family permease